MMTREAASNWFPSGMTCGPMLLALEVSWMRNKMRKEKKKLWTHIFHVHPHSMAELFFISEKLVLESHQFVDLHFSHASPLNGKTHFYW